jgi:hypothetical protein
MTRNQDKIAHETDAELAPIVDRLDRLGASERASMPDGLAARIAERTAPLIAGRVRLVEADSPRVLVLPFGRTALAAGIALVLTLGAVILATRPGAGTTEIGPGRLAEVTLNDMDEFLAYGDFETEVESLFAETELMSAAISIESSAWLDEDLGEESL